MGYVPYVGFATLRRATVRIHLYFKRLIFMKCLVIKKYIYIWVVTDIIVKDSMGKVLATLSAPKDHIIAPDIAQATVALWVAIFCKELDLQRVILEGDALQVVQAYVV
jgi:hypothetical protein